MSVAAILADLLPEGDLRGAAAASVAEITRAGRAAWPTVAVDDDEVARHVATRWRDDPAGATPPAHAADYYLAIALARQEPGALQLFEERLVPEIAAALRQVRLPGGADDEVTQQVRVDLLVGDPAPRIGDYGGRGELAAWLRITTIRRALKLVRGADRAASLDELVLERWADAGPSPALAHLRATYAAQLKAALGDALRQLEVRPRNLLRQHVLDGLTIDELAGLYRVHRATCARWLADARAELAKHTRRRLTATLGLAGDEVDSVLRLLDSDIELSLSRLLREPAS